jgi:hypothetical protein
VEWCRDIGRGNGRLVQETTRSSSEEKLGCTVFGCGRLIMLVFVIWLFGACAGGDSQEEQAAAPNETTQETKKERTRESAGTERTERADASGTQAKQQDQPQDPGQRLESRIAGMFPFPRERHNVSVSSGPEGCWQVQVDYSTERATSIDYQMRRVYEAVYGDPELRRIVCDVNVNAYGVRRDDYGQPYQELYYSTTMGRDVAERINWAEPYSANFERIWTLNYKHPVVEQEEARQEAERILDCAVDEGFFDNWLCP